MAQPLRKDWATFTVDGQFCLQFRTWTFVPVCGKVSLPAAQFTDAGGDAPPSLPLDPPLLNMCLVIPITNETQTYLIGYNSVTTIRKQHLNTVNFLEESSGSQFQLCIAVMIIYCSLLHGNSIFTKTNTSRQECHVSYSWHILIVVRLWAVCHI